MKNQFLFLLFICAFSISANACLHATQNRIFPLGICSDGLVVIEIHTERGEMVNFEFGDELIAEWSARSYLKIYDKNRKEIKSEVLDSLLLIPYKQYLTEINKTFERGLAKAYYLRDFIPAKPVSIGFCNYNSTCSQAILSVDSIKCQAYLECSIIRKVEIDIIRDSCSVASNYIAWLGGFDYESKNEYLLYLCQGLSIGSIRKYKIGNTSLTIVHLANGSSTSEEEIAPNFNFDTLENSIFEEPTPYHGHGFDFLIWE
jgi:hypothetical protein